MRGSCDPKDVLALWHLFEPNVPRPVRIHVAIFDKKMLSLVLAGEKLIDSRFSVMRQPPFDRVSVGDFLMLKESSGPVRGFAIVGEVQFLADLTAQKVERVRDQYNDQILAGSAFWEQKRKARFGTLMRLERVTSTAPQKLEKRDRRPWVVFDVEPDARGHSHGACWNA